MGDVVDVQKKYCRTSHSLSHRLVFRLYGIECKTIREQKKNNGKSYVITYHE